MEPPRRHRLRSAVVAGVVLLLVGLGLLAAGCGDKDGATGAGGTSAGAGGGTNAAASKGPQLPFPPRANEPATSRGGGPTPAGRVIRLGGRPEGIAVIAGAALGIAIDDAGHDFAILDATTLHAKHEIPLLAGARHVTAGVGAAGGGRFLVPLEDVGMLAEVSADGGEPTYLKVGDHPHNVATAGDQIFVANEFGDSLTVVRGGKVRATVPVDVQPGGAADVGEGKLAVVSVRAYTIKLLDTQTLKTGPAQNAGYGPSHAVGTPDGRAIVADTRGGNVLVYSTRPRLKFIQRLALGGSPYGVAVDNARERLWVTDSGADKLYEISTAGELKVVKMFPTVRQPNTVAVNGKTGAVYVLGEAAGQLQMITP